MNIGGIEIGLGQPCRFVAEISNNHNGSIDRAYRLITAAKEAGAEFVKFQCYTPDELVTLRGDGPAPDPWGSQGWTMRSLYEKARTPLEWFPDLFQFARNAGIVPFSSVFGLESLLTLERCACPAYKIAALDNGRADLVDTVVSRQKPVFVSYRGMNTGYRGTLRLYCPPGYPTNIEDVALPVLDDYQNYVGLSSHCLAPELPIAAVARGCKLIEMHFQLEYEPSELESTVSLTPPQFSRMVESVRRTEAMLA